MSGTALWLLTVGSTRLLDRVYSSAALDLDPVAALVLVVMLAAAPTFLLVTVLAQPLRMPVVPKLERQFARQPRPFRSVP